MIGRIKSIVLVMAMLLPIAVGMVMGLSLVGGATTITGNLGSWNGSDGESFPNNMYPIFQNVTIPDPGAGLSWRVDSVTLTAWLPSSGGTGWEVWLCPGTLVNGQLYVDQPYNGTDLGLAIYGGPVGIGSANATTATASFTIPPMVGPGNYYLDIRPLTIGSAMIIARDGGANSYAGGAEGYFQPAGGTVGINANHDLVFALSGMAIVPEGPVDARNYNGGAFNDITISTAITNIGSANKTLLLASGTWTISNNVTVPSNINLRFEQGAILSIGVGYTFTINGPIDAPISQIFSGNGLVRGTIKVPEIYPEWWGAYSDGTNAIDTRKAIQSAVDYVIKSDIKNQVIRFLGNKYAIDDSINKIGVGEIESYSCPTFRGNGLFTTTISYAFGIKKPAFYIQGGSGAVTDGLIEFLEFEGDSSSVGIEVDGQNGLEINRCRFLNNAVGVWFHNKTGNNFTEYCVVNRSVFEMGCITAVEYTKTGTQNSFHGSGLMKCIINQPATATQPSIKIGTGCIVYNAPLDFQIWTRTNNLAFINSNGIYTTTYGTITVERFNSSVNKLADGATNIYHAGHIVVFSEIQPSNYLQYGNLYLVEKIAVNSNGAMTVQYKPTHIRKQLPAGGGSVTLAPGGGMWLANVYLIAPGYEYDYLLYLTQNSYGGYQVTKLANPVAFNQAGYGAPTFTFAAGNTLTITRSSYPANTVSAIIEATHIGQDIVNLHSQ